MADNVTRFPVAKSTSGPLPGDMAFVYGALQKGAKKRRKKQRKKARKMAQEAPIRALVPQRSAPEFGISDAVLVAGIDGISRFLAAAMAPQHTAVDKILDAVLARPEAAQKLAVQGAALIHPIVGAVTDVALTVARSYRPA